jgi:hypothetical protein
LPALLRFEYNPIVKVYSQQTHPQTLKVLATVRTRILVIKGQARIPPPRRLTPLTSPDPQFFVTSPPPPVISTSPRLSRRGYAFRYEICTSYPATQKGASRPMADHNLRPPRRHSLWTTKQPISQPRVPSEIRIPPRRHATCWPSVLNLFRYDNPHAIHSRSAALARPAVYTDLRRARKASGTTFRAHVMFDHGGGRSGGYDELT